MQFLGGGEASDAREI